jgi:hypothetical protein
MVVVKVTTESTDLRTGRQIEINTREASSSARKLSA